MDTNKYLRKSIEIDAVQVTSENIAEVAEWCNGQVIDQDGQTDSHIKVDVHRPLSLRQTQAFVGDWILGSPKGFKVYTDNAFRSNFVLKPDEAPEYQSLTADQVRAIYEDKEVSKAIEETVKAAIQNIFTNQPDTPDNDVVVDPKDAINGKR